MRRPDWRWMCWAFACVIGVCFCIVLLDAFAKG